MVQWAKLRRSNTVALIGVLASYISLSFLGIFSHRQEAVLICNIAFCISLMGVLLDNQVLDSFTVAIFPQALIVQIYDFIGGGLNGHLLILVFCLLVVIMDLKKISLKYRQGNIISRTSAIARKTARLSKSKSNEVYSYSMVGG